MGHSVRPMPEGADDNLDDITPEPPSAEQTGVRRAVNPDAEFEGAIADAQQELEAKGLPKEPENKTSERPRRDTDVPLSGGILVSLAQYFREKTGKAGTPEGETLKPAEDFEIQTPEELLENPEEGSKD